MSRLFFLLSESFKGLFRAKLPALISSFTISITLVVFSLGYYSYLSFKDYSFELKKSYRIDVFFDQNVKLEYGKEIFNKILLFDGIKQGEFIDKELAAKYFNLYFETKIEDVIGHNPLPLGGRFDVVVEYRKPSAMESLVRKIRLLDGINQASYRSGLVTRVDRIIDNLFNIFIIIGFGILILSIILVSNTIRLIVYSKEKTIETLKLLGATRIFIQFPFIIEGILQGIIGSIISLNILWLVQSILNYLLSTIINPIEINEIKFIVFNISFGVLLGLIGSYRGYFKQL